MAVQGTGRAFKTHLVRPTELEGQPPGLLATTGPSLARMVQHTHVAPLAAPSATASIQSRRVPASTLGLTCAQVRNPCAGLKHREDVVRRLCSRVLVQSVRPCLEPAYHNYVSLISRPRSEAGVTDTAIQPRLALPTHPQVSGLIPNIHNEMSPIPGSAEFDQWIQLEFGS